jgi:Family of unknown function (DUF6002)
MSALQETAATLDRSVQCDSVLTRYYEEVGRALAESCRRSPPDPDVFTPGWSLPAPDPALERFFSASAMSAADLGDHGGRRLRLLDLMGNPRTRTTKTFPSLLIVARAVQHLRTTDESVMIVTASSANKATALRDAVLRAYETGLADPSRLRIAVLVPGCARSKLWDSPLTGDPWLRQADPLAVFDTRAPEEVKALARAAVQAQAPRILAEHGTRLWYTLDLANYLPADTARAFFERDHLPSVAHRVHAHSVSSAFGLLGHFFGRQLASGSDWPPPDAHYLLVQHLGAPDMVASLYHGDPDHRPVWSERDGVFTQQDHQHFPRLAYAPDESLDATFYSHRPATSRQMDEIIQRQGGAGIVVSLAECLERYPQVRDILTGAVDLPADPRRLREWSLVMAVTGVLNALDRGLCPDGEVLVHASGSYQDTDFTVPDRRHLHEVETVDDLRRVLSRAAAA